VIELYESIHSAGVIHGDVSWRHILLSPSSHRARPKIRMIDFDCALDLGGVRDETKLAAWVEDEMDMVRAMLDLPGAWD